MQPKDLVTVWNAPDHSRLTPKQISIRLPMLVAAKLSALCEMYPRESKSKMIGDLLATALDQLEEGLQSVKGEVVEICPDVEVTGPSGEQDLFYERAYRDVGPKGKFWELTEKHLREMEKEAEIAEPWPVPSSLIWERE